MIRSPAIGAAGLPGDLAAEHERRPALLIELRVEQVSDRQVICEIVNGGALGQYKGINLPGLQLRVPALTPKDREDLRFALNHGANYIAVSFVRRPEDVLLAKQLVRRAGKDKIGRAHV